MTKTPLALAFAGLFLATGVSGGELLSNGGMEMPLVDGIAHGWGKNCYGQNTAVQFRAPLAIAKGKHYRISCSLRADGGVAAVNASLRLAARANAEVTLTATLWPGVRLDGTRPVLQARREPKSDWATFNDDDHPRKAGLTCRVTDLDRQPVCEIPLELNLDAKRGVETALTLPISGRGVFLAELLDGGDVLSELSLSVLPPPSSVPPEESVVGGHFRLDEFHLSVANAKPLIDALGQATMVK